jgi:hypothetical protein
MYVYASASACARAWQPVDDSDVGDSRASGGVVCNAHVHALHQGKHHRYFTTYSIAIAVLPTASTAGPTALPRAAAPTAPPPSSSTLALGASCTDAATSAIGDRSIKRRIATAHSRGTWSSLRSGSLVDTVRSVNLKRQKTRKKKKKKRSKRERKQSSISNMSSRGKRVETHPKKSYKQSSDRHIQSACYKVRVNTVA